jgi:hypothetical protein
MPPRTSRSLLLCALVAGPLAACGGDGAPAGGGSGGTGLTGLDGGLGGNTFNQCGVAAPPPAETGQCTAVTAPAIADFDDYVAGAPAGSYTYYVNGKPPAAGAQLGAILHVGDGSETNGTSVLATEMVPGAGAAGYAVQISNTNATNWGGLLMFYFIPGGSPPGCLNAQRYGGVEFSIRGSSPSRRIAVSVGMIDTTPAAENGLCDNANVNDCKSASIEMPLPADAAAWTQVSLPWSALTPGVGSGLACVPVTGQNIIRLVIQPLMRYPPPNYMFEPGPYSIAVDDVRFF